MTVVVRGRDREAEHTGFSGKKLFFVIECEYDVYTPLYMNMQPEKSGLLCL